MKATHQLDDQWKDMLKLVQQGDVRLTKGGKDEAVEAKDDYNTLMMELQFSQKRALAQDRLKTDEEVIKENKEKLEKMESDRVKRMAGEESDESDDEEEESGKEDEESEEKNVDKEGEEGEEGEEEEEVSSEEEEDQYSDLEDSGDEEGEKPVKKKTKKRYVIDVPKQAFFVAHKTI